MSKRTLEVSHIGEPVVPCNKENCEQVNSMTIRDNSDGVYEKGADPTINKRRARVDQSVYAHRLHYQWSQLEADRCGLSVGSASRPCPRVDRTLELQDGREYCMCPPAPSEYPSAQARFSSCEHVYKTIQYNTFCKNGCLKLTEVELFFLSSLMTRKSSSEWVLVYLGIGSGERFRYLRDKFFPGLTVIAFDPLDEFFSMCRGEVENKAAQWTNDGTNFTFLIRCFDLENDPAWIKAMLQGKSLALISDIRGINFKEDGHFDKEYDQEVQWNAIQRLEPVRSLVKFSFPSWAQFFDYVPGVLLKQVYTNWCSREVRLLIEGVPKHSKRYNAWEIYEKMMMHHECLRGLVYETSRPATCTACLDCCFDCTVLWDTVSEYASKNDLDPCSILQNILRYQVYTPPGDPWRGNDAHDWVNWGLPPEGRSIRWWDVTYSLNRGNLMQALAALEADAGSEGDESDWADILPEISVAQPELAYRLRQDLPRPATREAMIRVLGSLADPFTLLRTDFNELTDFCLQE